MHTGGGQDDRNHSEESPSHNEDTLSFIRTDVEKVLEFELLKVKEERKQLGAAFYETKAQKDIVQAKYVNLCSKLNDLLKEIQRYNTDFNKSEIDIAIQSDSSLAVIFENLKATFQDKHSKDDLSLSIISLEKEQESERQRLKQQIQILCREQEELKNELESSKSHAFSLLQKLSCARSELIASEENHRKRIASITTNFENEKQNNEVEILRLTTEKDGMASSLVTCNEELLSHQNNITELREEIVRLKEYLNSLLEEKEKLEVECLNLKSNHTVECLIKDSEHLKMDDLKNEDDNNRQLRRLEKECDRLRKHLVAMEERNTQEALEAEAEKEDLVGQVKLLRSKLDSSLVSVRNVQSDSSKQKEDIIIKLNEASSEKAELERKLDEAERLIARYSSSIQNLHAVLEQYEKNQHLMQLAELEKCRNDLRLESARCQRLALQNSNLENEHVGLRNELVEMKDVQDKLKTASTHINYFQFLVSERDEKIKQLAEELNMMRKDDTAKVDKILMKSLLMGYVHTPSSKKIEAFNVIGKFLDFSKDELTAINAPVSWTDYLKQQYSPIDHPSLGQVVQPQSFSELFIKFLEKESRPGVPILKMSTDIHEGYHHHNLPYGRSNSREQEPMQKFLQSLKQQKDANVVAMTPNDSNVSNHEMKVDQNVTTACHDVIVEDIPSVESLQDPSEPLTVVDPEPVSFNF